MHLLLLSLQIYIILKVLETNGNINSKETSSAMGSSTQSDDLNLNSREHSSCYTVNSREHGGSLAVNPREHSGDSAVSSREHDDGSAVNSSKQGGDLSIPPSLHSDTEVATPFKVLLTGKTAILCLLSPDSSGGEDDLKRVPSQSPSGAMGSPLFVASLFNPLFSLQCEGGARKGEASFFNVAVGYCKESVPMCEL